MSRPTATTDQEEEEPIVTCSELLEQIEDEEEELDRERALYGNCDVDQCTYPQGYIRRQALFTCKTCCTDDQLAGFCAACAYHCHANHEINEIYTKRFFRCDCGNSQLNQQPCKLYPDKDSENSANKYNDNFRGIYCTCKRPYPDKENPANNTDEMMQCIICEDWFHSQHLGVPLPMEDNQADQMDIICQTCVTNHPFLSHYDETQATTSSASDTSTCLLSSHPNEHHTIFLRDGWRKRLCRCENCTKMYDASNLTAIFDEADSIEEYEKQALAKTANLDADRIIAASLENLGYVRKLEVLQGINDFKQSLGNFLREKASNNGILTAEDVTAFFADLREKRQEKQTTMFFPPDNCKY